MHHEFLALLVCPSCRRSGLQPQRPERFPALNPDVTEELVCSSCARVYPVVQDVPVLFSDPDRVTYAIDEQNKRRSVEQVARLNQAYMESGSTRRLQLEGDKEHGKLAWEYFYWSHWVDEGGDEVGFLEGDRARIDAFLRDEEQGAGRLEFLRTIEAGEGGLRGTLLLNVGCGRDLLLEHMLERQCRVLEQDIVLDSLLAARKRGAHLCLCSDLAELPIVDASVDAVTSFGVLHHVWPIRTPFGHIMRVLKAGGGAYFVEPNAFALGTMAKSVIPARLFKRFERRQPHSVSPSPFEKCINPYVLRGLAVTAGARTRDVRFRFWRDLKGNLPGPLRAVYRVLLRLLPFLSARFLLVARKSS